MATMQGNYVALLVQASCPMPLDAVWVPGAVVYLVSIPAESDDKVTQVDGVHLLLPRSPLKFYRMVGFGVAHRQVQGLPVC